MESKDEVSDTDSGIILQSGEWFGESRPVGPQPDSPRPQAPRAGQAEWLEDEWRRWEAGRGLRWGLDTQRAAVFPDGLAWRSDPIWNRSLQFWP